MKPDTGEIINFAPGDQQPWPEMAPLTRKLSAPIEFPVQALGPILGPAAQRIHEVVGSPLAICCQSILAAATLSAQAHADVLFCGRRIPLSENFVTIGESGERKSAVDSWALYAHREYQKQRKRLYDQEMKDYKVRLKIYNEDLKAAGRERGADRAAAIESLEEPEAPLKPWLLPEEPTYEGLVKLFRSGFPSLGLFTDEGGRMLGGFAMNKENVLKTVASFSNLWDGKPISVTRASEDSEIIYGKRFSLHMMIQPKIAADLLLGNEMMVEQGFLSRCLTSFPKSTAGYRPFVDQDLSKDASMIAFWDKQFRLLNRDLPIRNETRNELEPRTLELSEDAKGLWMSFHNGIEEGLRPGGEYVSIRPFANKSAEHCQRLAGVLALNEYADCENIRPEHLNAAMDLTDYYLREALRLNDMGHSSKSGLIELAQKLLEWLIEAKKTVVTLRDVYTHGPVRRIRDRETAAKVMHMLYEHGYVRPTAEDGKTYELNPGVE